LMNLAAISAGLYSDIFCNSFEAKVLKIGTN
jgi:hypothetical protein